MAWTVRIILIAILMVITGSINTLSTKWADKQKAVGNPDQNEHSFDHPFFQAVGMFLGEMTCLVAYFVVLLVKRRQGDREYGSRWVNPLVFAPAAICDMCGTSLMYIGLTLTYASSFQMLRGAVIIFTALLSVAFLGHNIKARMWAGMIVIILGLGIVGVSDIVLGDKKSKDTNGIIAGDLLIIMAQIIVSVQMVYEEKFVARYRVSPLLAVGYEGLWGFIILGILLVPFYYIKAEVFSKLPSHRLEDPLDAFRQISNNGQIAMAVIGNIVSIAFFNFAGISITKSQSATTRMVLDSVRTLAIWLISLMLSWQQFELLQVFGFLLLIVGMCLYYNILVPIITRHLPCNRQTAATEEENEPILQQNAPGIQDNA
ncbi:solute carrier family 35 member F6-like [Mizuhopecten yessoensis]|uniref:Solute carrier family 35 member F6 n=1 Tax=Mizuhopecten yessoensis TaxID=6573 RepID=A0A210Q0F6_MIZYE|nr:solute carrier family 35 member F6-like [Mizuhopecten yessoensis]OWF42217.1 Solute carrier family 35 member F6 [Mizuhopecten yessoensis]